jgi:hypothetical protein
MSKRGFDEINNNDMDEENKKVKEGKEYTVYDGSELIEQLEESEVGDIISLIPNNQQGYVKYKVVLEEDGEKGLLVIDNYDMQMQESGYQSEGGGKRKSKKQRKTRKTKKQRKTRKSKKQRKTRKYRK